MFRNQYDTDVTTFSPAGRIHQVEYAMEAVKQGSACVGLRSKEIAVLAALKRSPSELASFQKKLFKVDDHMGAALSGLIADGRVLCQWMRNECLNHKYVFESSMPVGRLISQLSDKSQVYTQKAEKRPYGVGLLAIGVDKTGPHLYQTMPSGTHFEYKAQAMGARSQSAKTYLEKHFEKFENLPLNELIKHALIALKGTSQTPLTHRNCSIAYVGKNQKFTILEDDDMKGFVASVADEEGVVGGDDGGDDESGDGEKKEEHKEQKEKDKTTKGGKIDTEDTRMKDV